MNSNIIVDNLREYGLSPSDLTKKTEITYNRINFIEEEANIRVTIDFDITVHGNSGKMCKIIPNFFILEIKSNKYPNKIIKGINKNFHIRETNFSKYCVSLCKIENGLKTNKWKQIIKKYT